jgi:Domain of unknown function (DUF397)
MNGLGWRKSSYSAANGDCIEWRTSTYSAYNGACVEAGNGPAVVGVRDSKLGEQSPVLVFGAGAWKAFTERLKAGRTV